MSAMTPDPEKVQGLARQAVRIAIQRGREAAVAEVVMNHFWPNVAADEYLPLRSAVFSQYAAEDAALTWPAEQLQDERVTDAVPYPQLPTNAEFADILANGSADAELMAFRRLVATTGLNRAYRKWSMLLRAGEHAEYQEEIDRLIGEAVKAQAERDADVRAVAEACAGVVDGTVPQPIRHEYAVRRLRSRFADRIADLRAREGGDEA